MNQGIFLRELRMGTNLLIAALMLSALYFQLIMPNLSAKPEWESLVLLAFSATFSAFLALHQGSKSIEQSDQILRVVPISTMTLTLSRIVPILLILGIYLGTTQMIFLRHGVSASFSFYCLATSLGSYGLGKLFHRRWSDDTQVFCFTLLTLGCGFFIAHQGNLSWIFEILRFRGLYEGSGICALWISLCFALLTFAIERETHRPGPMR
ncbi:hypothetical protein HOF92_16335 [bacterium]|nr:hypothetical protein [bacterium]